MDRRDIGYSIYSRIESTLRIWLSQELTNRFGEDWWDKIPAGISSRILDASNKNRSDFSGNTYLFLEETHLSEIPQILFFNGNYRIYRGPFHLDQNELGDLFSDLYETRNKIAHVKGSFTRTDLASLVDIAEQFLSLCGRFGSDLSIHLSKIEKGDYTLVKEVPLSFYEDSGQPCLLPNNIPQSDYDPDGGFVGRKADIRRVKQALSSHHNVITISGAGGVGKTAIAHNVCESIIAGRVNKFDGIVWISAKEEVLTPEGIKIIDPILKTIDSVYDAILLTFGFNEYCKKVYDEKIEAVNFILQAAIKGIIIVIDNLETIQDEAVREFIKDIPPPHKVLVTSRFGLGEVERRYPMKELEIADACALFRTVAREKQLEDLVRMPDATVRSYVERMAKYPLVIKWALGQAALGRDLERVVSGLSSTVSDVSKFCFEYIYENYLGDNEKKIIFGLAVYAKPVTSGVLSHLTGINTVDLDHAVQQLTLASLIVPSRHSGENNTIETRYELLALTASYVQSQLSKNRAISEDIRRKVSETKIIIESAHGASRQYRHSLREMGADTDEERIAATWALTAYEKNQAGDPESAIEYFKKAKEIAPHFAPIYRNWATVENDRGNYSDADELMAAAVRLAPENPTMWFVWGNMMKRRQKLPEAEEYLRKALSYAHNDSPILSSLAEVIKRDRRYDEADNFFVRAQEASEYDATSSVRHKVVVLTARADLHRRWAIELRNERKNSQSLEKMKLSLELAQKAVALSPSDVRAASAEREVLFCYTLALNDIRGFSIARDNLERLALCDINDVNQRRQSQAACLKLVDGFLEKGEKEQAAKYLEIGKRMGIGGADHEELFFEAEQELRLGRIQGVLVRTVKGKSYGFVNVGDVIPADIFIHSKSIANSIHPEEFDSFVGMKLSFVAIPDGDGRWRAVRARPMGFRAGQR